MSLGKRTIAEFIGAFWLVFGRCRAGVLSAEFPGIGIGLVSFAFA